MKILVLFDGGGLAMRGLLNAGHKCVGVEIDPKRVELSKLLNPEAEHICADVLALDPAFIASFEGVWASPPCQFWSEQNQTQNNAETKDLLWWSLSLQNRFLWVENVVSKRSGEWGYYYNAAQFLPTPVQRRRRMIAGRYPEPFVYRGYKGDYVEFQNVCPPAVMASEIGYRSPRKDLSKEHSKFTKWYMLRGHRPTVDDMAAAQGLVIPDGWRSSSKKFLSSVIGNGVPVYMAEAFGNALNGQTGQRQLSMFS
jgi:site-specific DNA-cytosine methylase